jgi:hypothetical protein
MPMEISSMLKGERATPNMGGLGSSNARHHSLTPVVKTEEMDSQSNHNVVKDGLGNVLLGSGQDGLKKATATTIVWSRNALLVVYAL